MKAIERIMRGREVSHISPLHYILAVFSNLYGGIMSLRNRAYTGGMLKTLKLPCFVISIGNITVGGTGKTPMTICVAKRLQEEGYRIVVISRGYKGSAEKSGGIVSDGCEIRLTPQAAGEEPYMMALQLEGIPVIVGQDRYASGTLAMRRFSPDIILLDDAFQHRRLERDLDLILLDQTAPFGNMHLLPRGILREQLTGLLRGDALVFTRSDLAPQHAVAAGIQKIRELGQDAPIFKTIHKPVLRYLGTSIMDSIPCQKSVKEDLRDIHPAVFFNGKQVFAFSGIANNAFFKQTLTQLNCRVIDFLELSDHHQYNHQDLQRIYELFHQSGAELAVTTEKDFVKIDSLSKSVDRLAVIGVDIDFGSDSAKFDQFLRNRLPRPLHPGVAS